MTTIKRIYERLESLYNMDNLEIHDISKTLLIILIKKKIENFNCIKYDKNVLILDNKYDMDFVKSNNYLSSELKDFIIDEYKTINDLLLCFLSLSVEYNNLFIEKDIVENKKKNILLEQKIFTNEEKIIFKLIFDFIYFVVIYEHSSKNKEYEIINSIKDNIINFFNMKIKYQPLARIQKIINNDILKIFNEYDTSNISIIHKHLIKLFKNSELEKIIIRENNKINKNKLNLIKKYNDLDSSISKEEYLNIRNGNSYLILLKDFMNEDKNKNNNNNNNVQNSSDFKILIEKYKEFNIPNFIDKDINTNNNSKNNDTNNDNNRNNDKNHNFRVNHRNNNSKNYGKYRNINRNYRNINRNRPY
jgi:hypothetical protein